MDYMRYPPEMLAEMAKLRKRLERLAKEKCPCPHCGRSFNHFGAAKTPLAKFDFSRPPAMACPQCGLCVEPVIGFFGVGGKPYRWVALPGRRPSRRKAKKR